MRHVQTQIFVELVHFYVFLKQRVSGRRSFKVEHCGLLCIEGHEIKIGPKLQWADPVLQRRASEEYFSVVCLQKGREEQSVIWQTVDVDQE